MSIQGFPKYTQEDTQCILSYCQQVEESLPKEIMGPVTQRAKVCVNDEKKHKKTLIKIVAFLSVAIAAGVLAFLGRDHLKGKINNRALKALSPSYVFALGGALEGYRYQKVKKNNELTQKILKTLSETENSCRADKSNSNYYPIYDNLTMVAGTQKTYDKALLNQSKINLFAISIGLGSGFCLFSAIIFKKDTLTISGIVCVVVAIALTIINQTKYWSDPRKKEVNFHGFKNVIQEIRSHIQKNPQWNVLKPQS